MYCIITPIIGISRIFLHLLKITVFILFHLQIPISVQCDRENIEVINKKEVNADTNVNISVK